MVPDTADNVKQCICPICPTYRESKLMDILFCGKRNAKGNVNQKGCICPNCPVWKNYKLQDNYYCSTEKAV